MALNFLGMDYGPAEILVMLTTLQNYDVTHSRMCSTHNHLLTRTVKVHMSLLHIIIALFAVSI